MALAKMIDGVAAKLLHPTQVQLNLDAGIVGVNGARADAEDGGDLERSLPLTHHVVNAALLFAQHAIHVAGMGTSEMFRQCGRGYGAEEPPAGRHLADSLHEDSMNLALGDVPQGAGGQRALDVSPVCMHGVNQRGHGPRVELRNQRQAIFAVQRKVHNRQVRAAFFDMSQGVSPPLSFRADRNAFGRQEQRQTLTDGGMVVHH